MRWARVIGLALGAALVFFGLALLPTLGMVAKSHYDLWVPRSIRACVPGAIVVALGFVLQIRPGRIPEKWWGKLDSISVKALGDALAAVLLGVSVLMLACWVPHYLVWPWWIDTDHFAITAQAWAAGIRPYRDQIDFNFPGPTYLMWAFGKTFGWGKTLPLYAFDASMLLGLGLVLTHWARARFGSRLPGLTAYVVILAYYLDLSVTLVAQRDWYATLFLVLGLMTLETWPGRAGRVAAALAFGLSLSFRPYGVLFVPAYVSALRENSKEPSGSPRSFAMAVVEWGLLTSLATVLAFSPLILAGVFDDFLRSLAMLRPGGAYSRNSSGEFLERLRQVVVQTRYFPTLAMLALVAALGRSTTACAARTWALAMVGVAFYKPLSPIAHNYLNHSFILVGAVGLGPVVAWILEETRLQAAVRLLMIFSVLATFVTHVPTQCDPAWSVEVLRDLARNRAPSEAPPGVRGMFLDATHGSFTYGWTDYCATIDHLKRTTDPTTRVANVLRNFPYPAINGPAGRLTVFASASAIPWLLWFGSEREEEFALALANAKTGTVVVWAPEEIATEPNLVAGRLTDVIRRCYLPEAKFGVIEVWRRARQ